MAGTRYCERCGAVLQSDFRFCEACGAPVRVLASGPSGVSSGPGFHDRVPNNGEMPDFGSIEYNYGGYGIDDPARMTGRNEEFFGKIPDPVSNSVDFYTEESRTEILDKTMENTVFGDRFEDIVSSFPPGHNGPGPGSGDNMSAGRDIRYDLPASKPKIKNSMGHASSRESGRSAFEEVNPYFRQGGDL